MSISALQAALQRAGWIPEGSDPWPGDEESVTELLAKGNLLEWLDPEWRGQLFRDAAVSRHTRRNRLAEWGADQCARGAWLGMGIRRAIPGHAVGKERVELPAHLAYWPLGIPGGIWIGVVSSRMSRLFAWQPAWLDAFRAACAVVQDNQGVLLSSLETTTAPFTSRAPHHFGLISLTVRARRPSVSIERWLSQLATTKTLARTEGQHEVWVSPSFIPPNPTPVAATRQRVVPPLRDEAIVALADWLFVVHLRRRGNLDQLVRRRMQTTDPHELPVFMTDTPQLIASDLVHELIEMGATRWDATERPQCNQGHSFLPRAPSAGSGGAVIRVKEILHQCPFQPGTYLTHCTRGAVGPWPDQTSTDYIDELLMSEAPVERTPLASLSRIVAQRIIFANGIGIRGGTRVVCFTETPLNELLELRVFRPHRGRWDFEPYGICIRRSWLEQCGARRAIYGDEQTWSTLSADRRPFFQRSLSGSGKRGFDWTAEREWRHVGNVELDRLPPDTALLFVPTDQAAISLARTSPWPIVVLSRGA